MCVKCLFPPAAATRGHAVYLGQQALTRPRPPIITGPPGGQNLPSASDETRVDGPSRHPEAPFSCGEGIIPRRITSTGPAVSTPRLPTTLPTCVAAGPALRVRPP